MRTAYLLVQIDPETLKVVSAGVFSEESPTGLLALRWATVEKTMARDYQEASERMWKFIDHPQSTCAWLRPLLEHCRPRTGTAALVAQTA